MDARETLTVFAQISAAFAGFGGLAGILAERLAGKAAALGSVRLRAVIEWALVVGAFSLIPLVAVDLARDAEAAWRVLSASLAAAAVAHRIWAARKLRGLPWGGTGYRIFTYAWLFGTALVLLANACGLFAPVADIYLGGLLSYLLFAMLLFARLLQSLV